jgi:uncharacterized protein
MWNRVAELIIRFRVIFIILIAISTLVMAWYASKVQMSYDFAKTVPPDDPDMVTLTKFREQFGEDGNIIAVGFRDSAVYELNNFVAFREMTREIRRIEGVNEVISLPVLKMILKDTAESKFFLYPIFPDTIRSQSHLDSLLEITRGQKIYMDQLVNSENGATMMLVSVHKDVMNSAKREALKESLEAAGKKFEQQTGVTLRYAGLPYIRTVVANSVRQEMQIFLYASVLITGIIMFIFFRSFRAVLFSMIIIGIVVIWTLGTLSLFGYRITLLSGLIPPVIVTLGITNAIYLLNKYHLEFDKTKDKFAAISVVVQKMGLATFLTNLTVAIGFLTLLATDITILREFGIVAGINIMVLFFVSLIMIPSIFSWLPVPTEKHLRHLTFPRMGSFLRSIDLLVHRQRTSIYVISVAVAVVSVVGIMQLRSVSFMVDDVPEESQVKKDLKFFEANFSGIMPLKLLLNSFQKKEGRFWTSEISRKWKSLSHFWIHCQWFQNRYRW